jgi:hypothetical protein
MLYNGYKDRLHVLVVYPGIPCMQYIPYATKLRSVQIVQYMAHIQKRSTTKQLTRWLFVRTRTNSLWAIGPDPDK